MALLITIIMVVLIFALPRTYIIIPFCILGYLVTEYQRIVIAGFDFTLLRILITATLIRFIFRGEFQTTRFYLIDKIFMFYVLSYMTIYSIRFGTIAAVVWSLGYGISALGIYFFFRVQLRDHKDIIVALKTLAIFSCITAVLMLNEYFTGKNFFYIFGGVPEFTVIREGKLRCQGAFGHPLLAGAFGATSIPLFFILRQRWGFDKFLGYIAIGAGIIITFTSNSSGPVMALGAALFSIAVYSIRYRMQLVRRTLVLTIIGLHFCMEAPVWALIGRASIVGGSTGYHRFILVDNAIRRFGEWWLLGSDTAHWGRNLWDVTNTYISIGVRGGFLTLVLFIVFISLGFKLCGNTIFRVNDRSQYQKIAWLLGSALFAHVTAFFGMNYFGAKIHLSLYLLFAIIIVHANQHHLQFAEHFQT